MKPHTIQGHRTDIADLYAEKGYKVGAEIGTARGDFAFVIASRNPQAKLYCIDPWETYNGYADFTDEQMNANYINAVKLLKRFDNVQLVRQRSINAVARFDEDELDFVYIDANHKWLSVCEDLYFWSKKVRTGGIVSGHDYGENKHVTAALHGYTEAFDIKEWYVIDDGCHAAHDWYWVKP